MTSILVHVQGRDGPTQEEARLPTEEEREKWHVDQWRVDDFRPQPDQLCLITYAKLLLDAGAKPEPSGLIAKAIADSKRGAWEAEIRMVGDQMRLFGQEEMRAAPGAGLPHVHSPSAQPGKIIYLGPGSEKFKVHQPPSGKMSDPELVKRAKAIQETYHPRFEMPANALKDLEDGKLDALAMHAFVLYPEGEDLKHVQDLALKRAPCNIAGRNLYNTAKLRHAFGWDEGYYDTYYNTTGEILPNIAIACKTPMWFKDGEQIVNVVNLIGYAFDSPTQADYKYFKANQGKLVTAMTVMWRHMFEAAYKMNVKKILWARVGGGAFSSMLADVAPEMGRFDQEVYEKLLQLSQEPVKEEYAKAGIELEPLGRIPDDVFSGRLGNLEEILFVNAWDMLSMVGNGNAGDHSLDGFFGRCTAMGVLCWPMTNPFLSYHPVKQGGWELPQGSIAASVPTSSYPPPSTDASNIPGTQGSIAASVPASSYPPLSTEASNIPGTQGSMAASMPASSYPPLSTEASNIPGTQGSIAASVPASSYPPLSTEASNIPGPQLPPPSAETIIQQRGHGESITPGAAATEQPSVDGKTMNQAAAATDDRKMTSQDAPEAVTEARQSSNSCGLC